MDPSVIEYSNFCSLCGFLLPQPTSKKITCSFCGTVIAAIDIGVTKITTRVKVEKGKEWRNKLVKVEEKTNKEEEAAVVEEECPKCAHHLATFYTMQTRSADEGQSVFYTCRQCSYKWKHNN